MNHRGRSFDAEDWEENMPTCGGDMECTLGLMCPCWEAGAEVGEQEGELREQEEAVAEALSTAKAALEKVFNGVLEPLEKRQIWKEDHSVEPQIAALQELKRKVLEVVS